MNARQAVRRSPAWFKVRAWLRSGVVGEVFWYLGSGALLIGLIVGFYLLAWFLV